MSVKTYQGTVDRLEGKFAVIKLTDGTEVLWPTAALAEGITSGSRLQITLKTGEDIEIEKTELAKEMLNEILNVKSDSRE